MREVKMSLTIHLTEQKEGTFLIRPEGRLDSDTYILFEEKTELALNKKTKILILDLEKLEYISSIGLSSIFKANKYVEDNGGTFIMRNLQPQIKKIFEIVKVLPDRPVFENMEEVDEYLDLMQKKEIEKQKNLPEE